jgi:hypothetical protein
VTRYKLNFGETAREAVFLFAHLRCPLLAQSGHYVCPAKKTNKSTERTVKLVHSLFRSALPILFFIPDGDLRSAAAPRC